MVMGSVRERGSWKQTKMMFFDVVVREREREEEGFTYLIFFFLIASIYVED
jgi:hypothetical protein